MMRRRGAPRSGGSSFPDADPATTDVDPAKRRSAAPGSGDGGSLHPCSCVWHGGATSGYWAKNRLTGRLRNGLASGLMDFFCFFRSINQGGRSKVPTSINRLSEAGRATAFVMPPLTVAFAQRRLPLPASKNEKQQPL
jgi:hypothetical protein